MSTAKGYMLRHQAAGVLYSRVYIGHPSAADVAAVKAALDEQYGANAPDGQPMWLRTITTVLDFEEGTNLANLDHAEADAAISPHVDPSNVALGGVA